jgi:hypothetical protein
LFISARDLLIEAMKAEEDWGKEIMALKGVRQALILKRASASRSSGKWNDDDFDVLANGVVVGRIFKDNASPVGASWMIGAGLVGPDKI